MKRAGLGVPEGVRGLLSALRTSRPVHPSEDVMVACMSPYCHGVELSAFREPSGLRTARQPDPEPGIRFI